MMHGKAGLNKAFCSNKQKADLCLVVLSFEIKLKSQVQEDQGEERGVIFGDIWRIFTIAEGNIK